MADEMRLFEVERGERGGDGPSEHLGAAGTDLLGRAAMAREVESDRAMSLGQSRLGEHPAVKVGAEAMDEDDRRVVAAAEIEIAQAIIAGFDVARRRAAFL